MIQDLLYHPFQPGNILLFTKAISRAWMRTSDRTAGPLVYMAMNRNQVTQVGFFYFYGVCGITNSRATMISQGHLKLFRINSS